MILLTAGFSYLVCVLRVGSIARRTPVVVSGVSGIIVLGMQLKGDELRPAYAQRLLRALRLYEQQGPLKIFLLGGCTKQSGLSEAMAGYQFLLNHGISEQDMLREEGSQHTLENLRNVREMLDPKTTGPYALISSRYHLARSLALAQGLGLTVYPCAAEARLKLLGDGTWSDGLQLLREAYYLHWYYTGKYWSRITGNQDSLARIS